MSYVEDINDSFFVLELDGEVSCTLQAQTIPWYTYKNTLPKELGCITWVQPQISYDKSIFH